jgi:D-lactate dehydrogenase (quinone)
MSTKSNRKDLIQQLKKAVGSKNVLTRSNITLAYRKGFRFGEGGALAVVIPETILEQWLVVKACVDAKCIIIIQAANTGLTGGSTPSGNDYDRDVVIINTLKINSIHLVDNNRQAVSLSGATLHGLEVKLQKINREPHSVIGSSQIGATIIGGVANNSGGALVKHGPSYTEYALYAQVDKYGNLNLINHLGIDELGSTPEEILCNVQEGNFKHKKICNKGMASDTEYIDWIRDIGSEIPARFNADDRRLFEASGCAGKVCVFAVRTNTFPKAKKEQVFYIGTNNAKRLSILRRDILSNFKDLPDVAEYMHSSIFSITERYGKDIFLAVKYLGSDRIHKFFKIKEKLEQMMDRIPILPSGLLNKTLFSLVNIFPKHLPNRMTEYRDKYEHHLILGVRDEGICEMKKYLDLSWTKYHDSDFFTCTNDEGADALTHRFSAGGAAGSCKAILDNKVGDILALDVALRRNDEDWVDNISKDIENEVAYSLYYGHFLCNVFHRNYILKKGADKDKIKLNLLNSLDHKGAKYPAEHNVGHLYEADSNLQEFYSKLDPTNTFNPGIGNMSKDRQNCNCCF